MKHFFVVGNPIKHSLSPKLHNYWLKNNNIQASYEKKLLRKENIKDLFSEIRANNISGVNVTLPFKKLVIPLVDDLTSIAKEAQSVNTIYKLNGKVIGDNTDVGGFQTALEKIKYKYKDKKVLILGAGGVVPSIIIALKRLMVGEIFISNRTKENADLLKKKFTNLNIIDWGKLCDFDIIINATSIGLNNDNGIKLDNLKNPSGKLFYDLIYNPSKTQFLLDGEKSGALVENGKLMFIHQAQLAFQIWHGIKPLVDDKTIKLLEND